jgi:hypothetical protein
VNIRISAEESLGHYELKQHKLWFGEWCSKLLYQRRWPKLQLLQHLNQINDNLRSVRQGWSGYLEDTVTKKDTFSNWNWHDTNCERCPEKDDSTTHILCDCEAIAYFVTWAVFYGTKWLLWCPHKQSPTFHSKCRIAEGLTIKGEAQ